MAAKSIGSVYCGLAAWLLLSLAAIRYDKAIVAVCLAFCAVYWRATAATLRRHRGLLLATAALLAWIALLTWLRDDRISRLLLIQYASFAACFIAALAALEHVDDPARAARIVLAFLLLTVLFVLIPERALYSGFLKVFQPFGEHQGRWSSIFNNPNNYGIGMAASFGVAVSLWLQGMIGIRVLSLATAVFVGQIYLSGSRAAVAAVAAVAATATFALLQRRRSATASRAAVALGLGALVLVAAAAAAVVLAPDSPWGRSASVPLGVRQIAWSEFLRLALEHPVTGTSAARFLTGGPVSHGHNLLLTLSVEWGLIGLALCLLWASRFHAAVSWSWPRAIAVMPFLIGQVVDDFHYFRPFGILAGMVAAWCAAVAPPSSGSDIGAAAEQRAEPPSHGAGQGRHAPGGDGAAGDHERQSGHSVA